MNIVETIEHSVIRGADRALRRASARSAMRATQTEDGAVRTKHERNAALWAACADDVAAMKGPRADRPDEPDPAPADPSPDAPADGGGAVAVPQEKECA